MAYLNLDGFKLYYEVHEGLVDHDTLMIHGNLACHLWWHPSVEVLRKRTGESRKGRLVIADWRGCGNSKGLKDRSEINFEGFAGDYLSLIESLGLKDINVVGHSTGGLIAMLAILRQPKLFRSCVLLDSVGPRGIELQLPEDMVMGHFQAISENEKFCTQVIGATIEGVDFTSEGFKAIAKASFDVDKPIWLGVIQTLVHDINIVDRMPELTLPVLVMHGQKDMVLPLSGSEEMAKMLPSAELKVFEEQGHSFNFENPEGFVTELEAFWSK